MYSKKLLDVNELLVCVVVVEELVCQEEHFLRDCQEILPNNLRVFLGNIRGFLFVYMFRR
jgi:hypothetical protein